MMLEGFEEEGEGEDAAEQVGVEEERGDTTETEELPSSEEKEEAVYSGGVSVEGQAWKETTLIARGEMVVPRLRSWQRAKQGQTEEEVQIIATVVGVEEGGRTPGKKAPEKGRQRSRGRSAWKKKKTKGQLQGGVQSDRRQGVKAMGEPRDEGQGGPWAAKQGGVPSDSKRKRKGEVLNVKQKYPTGQGPGGTTSRRTRMARRGTDGMRRRRR